MDRYMKHYIVSSQTPYPLIIRFAARLGDARVDYTRAHAISWMAQSASAVSYLHSMKPKPMLHRDLKTLNILLTHDYRHAKLADFGFARMQALEMTNGKGTIEWMAPEVIIFVI